MNERSGSPSSRLRLAELLAGLSLVTDMGMGQPPESAMRACLLATALARRQGLRGEAVSHIFYTTLLRYLGCTSFAHEEALVFGGDDIALRSEGALVEGGKPRQMMAFMLLRPGRGLPLPRRALSVARAFAAGAHFGRELEASHCEVGSRLAGRLGLQRGVQRGLYQVMEQWDGKGGPQGLAGEEICLPARYALLATRATLFENELGEEAGLSLLGRWAGTVFDPELVAALLQARGELLEISRADDALVAVLDAEPQPVLLETDESAERVVEALGDLVDLKIPFLRGHSREVAELAAGAAREMAMDEGETRSLRLAGHLHDIGRVGIANGVWEKPTKLDTGEWEQVRLHAYRGERLLARIPALSPLAGPVGAHHERLDGSGYHRQSRAGELSRSARILAAADAYAAMLRDRPYRPALSPERSSAEMVAEVRAGRLDGEAVEAVLSYAGESPGRLRREWPSGLSDREVEVLRLLAEGTTNKGIAKRLGISPKTVGHHVGHIYDKIGVSTRAAAVLFAMERELILPT